eukprot:9299972-Alexandrium_andersonii.AAC.1
MVSPLEAAPQHAAQQALHASTQLTAVQQETCDHQDDPEHHRPPGRHHRGGAAARLSLIHI